MQYVDIDKIELLLNESSNNVRKQYFDSELRILLNYYNEKYNKPRLKKRVKI